MGVRVRVRVRVRIKWDGWDVNMGSLPEGVLNEKRGC